MGVPVFRGQLRPDGNPDPMDRRWKNWQNKKPSHAEVDRWKPGEALCAVTGHTFDVLDMDPRNGGRKSFSALTEELGDDGPEVYWEVWTPSGGRHLFIATLGIRKATGFRKGLDLQAGDAEGEGRGFVFLPPTVRPSKVTGEVLRYRSRNDPIQPPATDTGCDALRTAVEAGPEGDDQGQAATSPATGSKRTPIERLRKDCLEAEAGEQRPALLKYVHELERQGVTEQEIIDDLIRLVRDIPVYNTKDPWYPATRRGRPEWHLRGLLHRKGTVIPDATEEEMGGDRDPVKERDADGREQSGSGLGAIPAYPTDSVCGPLRDLITAAGNLPTALVAGAGLAALSSLCASAWLTMPDDSEQRPALWIPLVAPRGGGKSPSIEVAFREYWRLETKTYSDRRAALREWNDADKETRGPRPADETRLIDDFTMERLARFLDSGDGTGTVVSDELSGFLKGLGQYKNSGGSDQGRLLSLWSCTPWRFSRVDKELDLLINNPVVSIVGGIQPAIQKLLGDDQTGLRPRWLPHVVPPENVRWSEGAMDLSAWTRLVKEMYGIRHVAREWVLDGDALELWRATSDAWKNAAVEKTVSDTLYGALGKADVHCARIALVLAESMDPGCKGDDSIPIGCMRSAVAIMNYVLACWKSLPSPDTFAVSAKGAILRPKLEMLVEWLESHGGSATKRQIQQAHVAGVRSAGDVDALLDEYKRVHSGTVRTEKTGKRGPATTMVYAPQRT